MNLVTVARRALLPLFALAVKAVTVRTMWQRLLASYLGQDPADRVLSGSVRRGEVQEVEAVLFYADLRDFTRVADTLPGAPVARLERLRQRAEARAPTSE